MYFNHFSSYTPVSSTFEVWTGYPVDTVLEITSEFIYEQSNSFRTYLDITNEFEVDSYVSTREVINTLSIRSVFGYYIITLNKHNSPIPNIDPIPQPLSAGLNRVPTSFKMYTMADILYVDLPAPEFGDTDRYEQRRENKYSRGNTLINYRDSNWKTSNIYEYSFAYMTKIQKITLLDFIRFTLGQKIKIIDHLNVTRVGFVLTPEAEMFEAVKKGFSATIQFQQVS